MTTKIYNFNTVLRRAKSRVNFKQCMDNDKDNFTKLLIFDTQFCQLQAVPMEVSMGFSYQKLSTSFDTLLFWVF